MSRYKIALNEKMYEYKGKSCENCVYINCNDDTYNKKCELCHPIILDKWEDA